MEYILIVCREEDRESMESRSCNDDQHESAQSCRHTNLCSAQPCPCFHSHQPPQSGAFTIYLPLSRCQDVHLRSTSNLQTLYAHAEHCSSCCVCSLLCTVINYHLLTSDDALALPLYPCLTRRQDSRCKINAVFSRCKPNASIPC